MFVRHTLLFDSALHLVAAWPIFMAISHLNFYYIDTYRPDFVDSSFTCDSPTVMKRQTGNMPMQYGDTAQIFSHQIPTYQLSYRR